MLRDKKASCLQSLPEGFMDVDALQGKGGSKTASGGGGQTPPPALCISRQCQLLSLNKSSLYYKAESTHFDWDEALKQEIQPIRLEDCGRL
jgi:hypothetical protein